MGGWLAVIFIGLVLLAYLFEGIGWLFTHELPAVILVALILVIIFAIYIRDSPTVNNRRISATLRDVEALKPVGARASKEMALLAEDRQTLERKARQLEELRRTLQGDVNFQVLTQQHHESRLIADSWHAHKAQATRSRRELSSGIDSFNSHTKKLARTGSASGKGLPRPRFTGEIATAQATINHLAGIVANLLGEIERSRAALTLYNAQTGRLRDHIRDNCGPRGRRWYDDMQQRKRDRDIDT
jgi:chromosome segregation ATPase